MVQPPVMTPRNEYDFEPLLNIKGPRKYRKASYPVHYGIRHEITSGGRIYSFGLNGVLKSIRGTGDPWPPNEWLKRNASGRWIYYSTGRYSSVYDCLGEYYLPCTDPRTNSIFAEDPFKQPHVIEAMVSLKTLPGLIAAAALKEKDPAKRAFLISAERTLRREDTDGLNAITGSPVTVLPPDTRHVDYDVMPLIIADGCLFNCSFCSVKAGEPFRTRDFNDIASQAEGLRQFHGEDRANYNSLFIGQHDALNAGINRITFAAEQGLDTLGLGSSYMDGLNIFMFGSVDSLMNTSDRDFDIINGLPCYTYINIGLESADDETLRAIGKPLTSADILDAMKRMTDINRNHLNLEITANFLFGAFLPEGHEASILSIQRKVLDKRYDRGCLYLSYCNDGGTGMDLQKKFNRIKNNSLMPVYLYIIQGL